MSTIPQAPATTLLYNDWYPAMRSESLRGKKLHTAMLLGIPLVLGRRQDGKLFAMRDSCPHRGIPLSCGWFDGRELTCKYHGWAFEPASGQCMQIPSLTFTDTLGSTSRSPAPDASAPASSPLRPRSLNSVPASAAPTLPPIYPATSTTAS